MKKIIITMPASILKKHPMANRQLTWQPVSKRRFCFLQLGWSGGRPYKAKRTRYVPSERPRLSVVR